MNANPQEAAPPVVEEPNWGQLLLDRHHQLHDEFFRLLLAASFGSLFFLTQFQPMFPKDTRVLGGLLDYSWLCAGVAVVSGSIHFGLLMLRPMFAERLRVTMINDLCLTRVPLSDEARGDKIKGYLDKCIAWHVFYWLHLASFTALIVLLTVFKFNNKG